MASKTYFDHLDLPSLLSDYPMGAAFLERYTRMSRDELWALQDQRFQKLLKRGWEVPFYRRLWSAEGLEPGDLGGLDDLPKLPVYDKSDLMASIEAHPPFGDFSGCELGTGEARPPVILHTTSGTTGNPQVLTFGPKGREVANLLVARMYQWQGLRDSDVMHSVYGHGTINGGHYIREAVTHFTNALFISAGTGLETPSERQVGLIREFGATVLVGFVDYLRKLATVAREHGFVSAAAGDWSLDLATYPMSIMLGVGGVAYCLAHLLAFAVVGALAWSGLRWPGLVSESMIPGWRVSRFSFLPVIQKKIVRTP